MLTGDSLLSYAHRRTSSVYLLTVAEADALSQCWTQADGAHPP
ncbi:hypothetical protein MMSP_3425 [Mycobacterium sp. 012931]|nr:hypothetical protein MMSP_3425 [Mycobacterium sp. 012931]